MKEILGIKLYTRKEVGELLGVKPTTVTKYIQEGRLKYRVIGVSKYITEDEIKDFLKTTQDK